ncbi:hypothetical protein ACQPZQ_05650 [Pseudonocardia sp. CA-142604]|uniref:hypothetical protein n=1 Tax=Pseudonocardia sp. CA-142604 TaxID=3240024 RepID=UPI003D9048E6
MSDELLDFTIHDVWDSLPAELRGEFLNRRSASTGWRTHPRREVHGRRWEPLRPMVIGERDYRGLGYLTARLLHLAVDACRRRASTLGDLHQLLRFPYELPLLDRDRPLLTEELTRFARPDLLIEQARPRLLEFNNSTRLGGGTTTPKLAEAYAQLCPESGMHPPPSTVTARSAALARTLRAGNGNGHPGRLLMPAYRAIDRKTGSVQRGKTVTRVILADAHRVGIDVVQADLADLRLDAAGRLLAADEPVDVVLLRWGSDRIVDDGGGLAALRSADRARTVVFFPRTESALISSKAILAWLHEDCDAGLLTAADRALVRAHVPWTTCLGLDGDPAAQERLLSKAIDDRHRLVAKPAVGRSGTNVFFGSQMSKQDWTTTVIDAARESPVVVQQRVVSDRMTMPFHDRDSGRQVTAQVPFVLGPYLIDGAAASVAVRHMGPDVPSQDVVIGASRGGYQSAAVLVPEASTDRSTHREEQLGVLSHL